MSIRCLMNGLEVNYPCSPVCALFGDCVTAFEKQKKANVSTNADRIRAMSDEELAKMIDAFNVYFDMCNRSEIEVSCEDCELNDLCSLNEGKALDWLRQPVKDGDNDVD